ncbi:hypothetical protein LLG07_06555 [bacterium]|nr:hypothetical protein [bacterium]
MNCHSGSYYNRHNSYPSDVKPRVTDGIWILDRDIISFTAGDYKFEYKLISEKEIRWTPGGKEIIGTDLNWSLLKK